MKYTVFVLLALAAVHANGHEIAVALEAKDRSISSSVVDAIYDFQTQMPCGFPGLGLGPLAPAHLSHKEIHINGSSFKADGSITDFDLYGLDDFDVIEFKINTILSRVTFEFHWHKVHVHTAYDMLLNMGGSKLKMGMNGIAKLAIDGFKVWGRVTYSLGLLSGNVRVKTMKVYASLDNVTSDISGLSGNKYMNKLMNEVIEEFITLTINDNTDNIAEMTDAYGVPLVNGFIGEKSLTDLIGMVVGGGGGGGDGGDGQVKEPCVATPRPNFV